MQCCSKFAGIALGLVLAAFTTPFASSQAPAQKSLRYRSNLELGGHLHLLTAATDRARVRVIGRSTAGEEIYGVEIGRAKDAPAPAAAAPGVAQRLHGRKPALLIVAGLRADRIVGSAVATRLVERLVSLPDAEFDALFERHDVYVVPRGNPDAVARHFATVKNDRGGNARRIDRDRDGRVDEDGPADLDGDAQILQMRVVDPAGTMIEDPDNPRVMRSADAAKGETGRFLVHAEGRDADGDGDIGEDGDGGILVDRNFPHGFKEHVIDTGVYPTSEPESRALVEFVVARTNIEMVLVYGRRDNLAKVPEGAKPPGRVGRSRRPATKPQPEDRENLVELAKLFRESNPTSGTDSEPNGGAFHEWAYFHRGITAMAVNLFEVDVAAKPSDEEKEDAGESAGEPAADPVADEMMRITREGFQAWNAFQHPDLGAIEIGGWRPFARTTPDGAVAAVIADRQLVFVKALMERFARVDVSRFDVMALSDGIYEIRADIANTGWLPSSTQQGVTCREALPVIVELAVDRKAILQGRRRHLIDRLVGRAGRRSLRWVIRAEPGSTLQLICGPSRSQAMVKRITLP